MSYASGPPFPAYNWNSGSLSWNRGRQGVREVNYWLVSLYHGFILSKHTKYLKLTKSLAAIYMHFLEASSLICNFHKLSECFSLVDSCKVLELLKIHWFLSLNDKVLLLCEVGHTGQSLRVSAHWSFTYDLHMIFRETVTQTVLQQFGGSWS